MTPPTRAGIKLGMGQFAIGDVVTFKHDLGPDMTVEAVWDDEISCVWFDDSDHLHREQFPRVLLEKVNGEEEQEEGATAG